MEMFSKFSNHKRVIIIKLELVTLRCKYTISYPSYMSIDSWVQGSCNRLTQDPIMRIKGMGNFFWRIYLSAQNGKW